MSTKTIDSICPSRRVEWGRLGSIHFLAHLTQALHPLRHLEENKPTPNGRCDLVAFCALYPEPTWTLWETGKIQDTMTALTQFIVQMET